MAGRLLVPGWARALDSDGFPIPARISFFLTGTDFLASVYADEDLSTPLTNPVPSNSAGRFPAIWAADDVSYDWSVEAPYGPPGTPFTGTGLTTALASEVLAADAAEAAADAAALSAGESAAAATTSETALADILAISATGDQAPAINARAAKSANLSDLADTADATENLSLLQTGTGSVLDSLADAVRRGGIFPEQKGAVGNGSTNDATALTNAANSAVAAGVPLILQPGKNYRINTGLTLPAGLEVSAYGATISTAANITMLTVNSSTAIRGLKLIGPSATYNALSIGVAISGTVNGAGVAPTYKSDITLEDMSWQNIGNLCIDPRYVDRLKVINPTARNFGYGFLISQGTRDCIGIGGLFKDATGITSISDLECLAVSWSCNDNDTDFVRYPNSERCVWYGGAAIGFSWQPFDVHGAVDCGFVGPTVRESRRAVWLTARTGQGPVRCFATGVDAVNTSAAFSTYTDGNERRGEAFLISGDADTNATTRAQACYISGTCTGFGGLNGTIAAILLQNCDLSCGGDMRVINPYASGIALNAGARGIYKLVIDNVQSPGTGGSTVAPRYVDVTATGSDVVNVRLDAALIRSNPALNTYVGTRAYSSSGALANVSVNFSRFSYDDGINLAVGSDPGTVSGEYPVPLTIDIIGITGLLTTPYQAKRDGNDAVLNIPILAGTSSSTGFILGTTTPLPAYLRPSDLRRIPVYVMDNGTAAIGIMEISTAGLVTIYKDPAQNGWTASGAKRLYDSTVRYSVN